LGCAQSNHRYRFWDIKTGTIRRNLVGHEGAVHTLIGFEESRTLISGAADGTVRIWDIESGIELHRWECSDSKGRRSDFVVRYLALTTDGFGVAVGGGTRKSQDEIPDMIPRTHDCAIRLLRLSDLQLVRCFEGPAELVTALIFQKNSDHVLCATQEPRMFGDTKASIQQDASIGIWDITTGKEIDRIKLSGQKAETVRCLAWTPNGRLISGTSNDRRMGVWRPESYVLESFISLQDGEATAIALIPNKGELIASGAGGIIRIWDINTKREISKYSGHIGSIISLESSADGELLASASDDGTVKIWRIEQ
jgi:WD40 repeat protein